MKLRKFIFLLLLASLVVGCATPKAVKQLSTEIADVNVKYHQALTTYFGVIEKFVDSQIKVAEFLIADLDEGIAKDEKKKVKKRLEDKQDINQVLDDYEKALKSNITDSQAGLNKLAQLYAQLKSKHKELLTIQSTIIDAQRKLDEYIQLEKADEAIVNELMGIVGGQFSRVTDIVGDISTIYDGISTVIKDIE